MKRYKRGPMKELCLLQKINMRNYQNLILGVILAAAVVGVGAAQAQTAAAPPGNAEQDKTVTPSASSSASTSTRGNISTEALKPKFVEPWNTPSIAGSDLKLSDVIPGGVDSIDGVYTHELTRVQWRPADPIDLYIIKPVGVKNPPVILYLYSYPFETDRFLNHDFCKF